MADESDVDSDDNRFIDDNPFSVLQDNDDIISNLDFELGFHNPNCHDEPNSLDDFNQFGSDDSSQYSDSDEAEETQILDFEDDAGFHLSWDAFHLDDPNPNPNTNPNANEIEDFGWEQVDDQTEERMFFGVEPDDDDASVTPVLLTAFEDPTEEYEHEHEHEHEHDVLQWQVLSNVHNFEPDDQDSEDQYDDYNYTEYEMFFGHFGDSDVPSSGRPPASKTAVDSLMIVVVTQEDVVNNNAVCAVCKDEVVVGEKATQLPCSHRYHGECILPWLAVRNTCPVCRYELPTDDVEYERRKAERGGQV